MRKIVVFYCRSNLEFISTCTWPPVLVGQVFSSSTQRSFTLVGGPVIGGQDMHVRIHIFNLSCSATAIELYLSCVAMS